MSNDEILRLFGMVLFLGFAGFLGWLGVWASSRAVPKPDMDRLYDDLPPPKKRAPRWYVSSVLRLDLDAVEMLNIYSDTHVSAVLRCGMRIEIKGETLLLDAAFKARHGIGGDNENRQEHRDARPE